MTGRRLQFSNPHRLLTEDGRLQELRDDVASILDDLDTLVAQDEAGRREDRETRDAVLAGFRQLSKY